MAVSVSTSLTKISIAKRHNEAPNGEAGGNSYNFITVSIYDTNISNNTASWVVQGFLSTVTSKVKCEHIEGCLAQYNKMTTVQTSEDWEFGGALLVAYSSNVAIRESYFMSNVAMNNQGNEIATKTGSNGIPTISIVNSYFENHLLAIISTRMMVVRWKTCTSITCHNRAADVAYPCVQTTRSTVSYAVPLKIFSDDETPVLATDRLYKGYRRRCKRDAITDGQCVFPLAPTRHQQMLHDA